MARRYYSAVAVATALNGAISAATTSISVDALSGYPVTYPWTAVIDRDTSDEEVVLVTAGAGTTLTVTRGYDGTTAKSHADNAVFEHGVTALDYEEANDHIQDSTGVHGLAGASSVVGTTDTQTLTNKTLTSPVVNTPTITGGTQSSPAITTPTITNPTVTTGTFTNPTVSTGTFTSPTLTTPAIADFTSAQHDHGDADDGGLLPTAAPASSIPAASAAGSAATYSRSDHAHVMGDYVCTSSTRPASPVAGQSIYETDTDRIVAYLEGAWTTVQDLGVWDSYTPTWTTSGSAPSIGNGSLVGRYRIVGKKMDIWIQLTWGSTTNGGTGDFTFTLPSGVTVQQNNIGTEQMLLAKCFTTGSLNWLGFGYVANVAPFNTVIPLFPTTRTDVTLSRCRNADGTGAIATGVPQISGGGANFTFTAAGHNVILQGTLEIN
jgi:hypothetical protein